MNQATNTTAAWRLRQQTDETRTLIEATGDSEIAATVEAINELSERLARHSRLVAEADAVLEQLLQGTAQAFSAADQRRDELERSGTAATAAFDAATVAAQSAQAAEANMGALLDRLQTARGALNA